MGKTAHITNCPGNSLTTMDFILIILRQSETRLSIRERRWRAFYGQTNTTQICMFALLMQQALKELAADLEAARKEICTTRSAEAKF
jgi:hypothetical protein